MKATITLFLFGLLSMASFGQGLVENDYSKFKKPAPKIIGTTLKFDGGRITRMTQCSKEQINQWSKIQSAHVYGAGSLFELITSDESSEKSTTTVGSLGLNFTTNRIVGNVFFSFNDKTMVDMNSLGQYGNSLMNPNIGGKSFSAYFNGRISRLLGLKFGLMVADSDWKLDSATTVDASPTIISLGAFLIPFDFKNVAGKAKVNVSIEANFVHRVVLGDFHNENRRIEGFEITKDRYNGFEVVGNMYINKVRAYVRYSHNLDNSDSFDIPGFTGSQFDIGFQVAGNMFKLR